MTKNGYTTECEWAMEQKEWRCITEEMVREGLPARPVDGHKGTFGHLLSVCGSVGMAGAACFAAEAAYRCGTGLVTAAMPAEIYPLVSLRVPETVCALLSTKEPFDKTADCLSLRLQKSTAVLFGCGVGQSDRAAETARFLMKQTAVPLIMDADGLNLLATHKDIAETTVPFCITPHPAEAARLLGWTTAQVEEDRLGAVCALADRFSAVAVLKGHETLVTAPGKPVLKNTTGNDALATGGSGDVLAGVIGGLAAQGCSLYEAAMCGVYLHGLAGERAAKRLSRRGTLARDLLVELASLLSEYE